MQKKSRTGFYGVFVLAFGLQLSVEKAIAIAQRLIAKTKS